MWKALQRYRKLPQSTQRLFWVAAALLLRVKISLRTSGYRRTLSLLERKLDAHQQSGRADFAQLADSLTICRVVAAATHHLFLHASCLEESLVLWYLLRVHDISASLRIGVRKQQELFEAHAWVELDGVALNQHQEQHRHYSPFDREVTPSAPERL